MMPLLLRAAAAAAVSAAAAAPANKKDTYCVLDTESGAPSCDTCEDGACDGWPGAQTRQECKRTCGASGSPGKRYAITSIENGRGSHAPVTFSCDDAIEQSSGEFCCFRRANQPETAWRVNCFDAGQPLAKYDVRSRGSAVGEYVELPAATNCGREGIIPVPFDPFGAHCSDACMRIINQPATWPAGNNSVIPGCYIADGPEGKTCNWNMNTSATCRPPCKLDGLTVHSVCISGYSPSSGSGRSALLPFAGGRSSETQATQRWTFYEESFATYGGEGSRYNQFDRECEPSPPPLRACIVPSVLWSVFG
jgi:hypothetical protein